VLLGLSSALVLVSDNVALLVVVVVALVLAELDGVAVDWTREQ
jgi:hypothetical protein